MKDEEWLEFFCRDIVREQKRIADVLEKIQKEGLSIKR